MAVAVCLIASVLAPVFVVTAFRVLANDWFVRFELGRDGFPPDRYGLAPPERLQLALTGLHSVQPGSEGIALLERATLPDGLPAFDQRELRHMADVRSRLAVAFTAQLVVLGVLVALALGLVRSTRWRSVVPRGLLAGSLLTLAIVVLAVPVILLGFDRFFLRFHQLFFEGTSWQFSRTDTLLRIYPEAFWRATAQLVVALVVVQAIAVALAAEVWRRAVTRPRRRA